MQTKLLTFNTPIDHIARILALIGLFFIPISTTLNALLVVAAVLHLFSGQLRQKCQLIFHYKTNLVGAALLALLFIGVFYNHHPHTGWSGFYKYATHMLVMFSLLPLFIETRFRRYAINTIITSATLITVYCIIMLLIHHHATEIAAIVISRQISPIFHSIWLAFAAYLVFYRLLFEPHKKWQNTLLFFTLFAGLFFINYKGTGIIVFFALMMVLARQRFGTKGLAGGLIASIALFSALYVVSPRVHERVQHFTNAIQHINNHPQSSAGIRYQLLQHGIGQIKAHPFFGQGTGLYTRGIYNPSSDLQLRFGRTNPENSFIHIALQIGLVGLVVFLTWFATQWFETRHLPKEERHLSQAAIVTMIISCCFIIAFYLNHSAIFYSALIPILFASRFEQNAR